MAINQIPRIIGFQILRSLNLLISSAGDNDLFGLAKDFFWNHPDEETGISDAFFYTYMIDTVINSLIDYYLSHVVAIMLILESERLHASNQSTADFINDNIQNQPTTRSVTRASSFLYRMGGLRMFLKGLQTGLVYRATHFALTSLLQMALFRHDLLSPIAHVISTVVLAELHMAWTHATISATSSTGSLLKLRHNHKAWRKLLTPSLVCAAARAVIDYLPEAADSSFNLFFKSASTHDPSEHYIAYFEVSTMLPTLILRMTVVLPAFIALILVEASFLSETETTIVPSTQGRRARMSALVWGKISKVRSGFAGVYGLVRRSTFFWLWELHAKRCLLQSVVDIIIMWLEGGFE
ncbi:hypothetical protein P875_00021430 [Aspergillus parasiticus SU-1]|uniref:Uncharacterized protein n=2 Tax=Aspergillus parasiticus TaxID=5067 RepID=A0A5N6DMM7_ASPPA|nr:hypothetical protein BDV34DRAFT_81017 [Aspergillus parasiticus]KJK66432.1 hypothetical protein P875_00021430 [Aspergillus parasiticus SU-1]